MDGTGYERRGPKKNGEGRVENLHEVKKIKLQYLGYVLRGQRLCNS